MKALVTGGAGFIGSHLVRAMLERGDEVVVLDDLSTGYADNLPLGVRLVEDDVSDLGAVREAVSGCEIVLHQAASRAVQRSVEDPIGCDRANVGGSLNVLVAARDAGVRRVVVASSSSVYGGVAPVPTSESDPVHPKSPYAVSKLTSEHYARISWELYRLETVTLRYFNVFGPRQRPDSAYAAVIPLFIDALRFARRPTVHGDGKQSRDFTYVDDVVRANMLALEAPADVVAGEVYNVARGEPVDLLELLTELGRILDRHPDPVFTDPRPGDVHRSAADSSKARRDLGWTPSVTFGEGLERTVAWFAERGV